MPRRDTMYQAPGRAAPPGRRILSFQLSQEFVQSLPEAQSEAHSRRRGGGSLARKKYLDRLDPKRAP